MRDVLFSTHWQRRLYLSAMEKFIAQMERLWGHGTGSGKRERDGVHTTGVTSVLGAETGSEKVDQVHAKDRGNGLFTG
ncbi:hypothetical protein SLA2020_350300 [Shorea laevis]